MGRWIDARTHCSNVHTVRARAGDVSLWFEVLGTKRVADGPRFVERPTIISVHGGPGFDSANGLEGAKPLGEFAQVIVFDQRGHGLSDYSTPDRWNLDTWADDIVALCAALDIKHPIVLGTSFGGFVVQRYAARHPTHALAHILAVTMPRFDNDQIVERFRALGGDEVAEFVRRSFQHSTPDTQKEWERLGRARCRAPARARMSSGLTSMRFDGSPRWRAV